MNKKPKFKINQAVTVSRGIQQFRAIIEEIDPLMNTVVYFVRDESNMIHFVYEHQLKKEAKPYLKTSLWASVTLLSVGSGFFVPYTGISLVIWTVFCMLTIFGSLFNLIKEKE